MDQHIGVALSGGGHRATMWSLGTLLYLVDSGKHREIAAISSVSGGSITNGVVAHEVDLPQTDPQTFDRKVSALVRHVADTGLFFWGPATNPYVVSVLVGLGLGVISLLVGVVLLLAGGLSWTAGIPLLVGVGVLAITAWWFERRSEVVDRALARTHFTRDGRPSRLADVARSIDHVFCATELHAAEHIYLTPGFLYSYRLGLGTPADLRLSTAVQASACLPGAFSPRRLPTAPHDFHGGEGEGRDALDVLLTDGGVYDNMADQWLEGLAARLRRMPDLPAVGRNVDHVIVVNASSAAGWTPLRRARTVLIGELATLRRVSSVMYQVTTERRRYHLVREWERAARAGRGQQGALVHISQSPYTVAHAYSRSSDPDRAARARTVLSLLGDDPAARAHWESRARASTGVATVLRKLGPDTTVDLLEHSYVLAMCNLHVLLGYPLSALPPRQRFDRLLRPPAQ